MDQSEENSQEGLGTSDDGVVGNGMGTEGSVTGPGPERAGEGDTAGPPGGTEPEDKGKVPGSTDSSQKDVHEPNDGIESPVTDQGGRGREGVAEDTAADIDSGKQESGEKQLLEEDHAPSNKEDALRGEKFGGGGDVGMTSEAERVPVMPQKDVDQDSVSSSDTKEVIPVAKPRVIRARYGSDPRGIGGVTRLTYKAVKEIQEEAARKIEEEIVASPDITSLPGYLPWEKDLEMTSAYQEKKESLSDCYQQYLRDNPELWALLADFVQALLIQKPDNVYHFAQDFFRPFDPEAPPPPSHPTTISDTGFLFAPGFFQPQDS